MTYTAKTFDIPALKGISQTNIDEHLKLYSGYVKHVNLILEEIKRDSDNPYAQSEMQRRLGFEFDGMRNHEYYFASLEGEAKALGQESALAQALAQEWGSVENWLTSFKALAKTRGIGWAILYYDYEQKKLMNVWVDEQHLGHLTGLKWIIGIDMWEHSFVADYQPSGKGQYIDDFMANVNWSVIEQNYKNASDK
ncbi:superoxide dismutase [Candidatus Wolfebacteria bacterium]|nr:MAG: superoxide dismutase [Candidatus Wolfebacteria bacterium]